MTAPDRRASFEADSGFGGAAWWRHAAEASERWGCHPSLGPWAVSARGLRLTLAFPLFQFVFHVYSGGRAKELISSIRNKLFPLGDDITFIPGHGPTSTFGQERHTNPFVADNRYG